MRNSFFRKISIPVILMTVAAMIYGCGKDTSSVPSDSTDGGTNYTMGDINATPDNTVEDSTLEFAEIKTADTVTEEGSDYTTILLGESSFDVTGAGVTVSGKTATITAAGTYVISGSTSEGNIYVDAADEDKVHIILNNVSMTCSYCAPIFVNNADKVTITLKSGTVNTLADKLSAVVSDSSNAVIYSKKDLSINGTGTLNITGVNNNGIQCQDDLKIVDGNITIAAANNAVRGKDSVTVAGGTLSISCKGNGIVSSNDTDPEKGYIHVIDGSIEIECDEDGIQAENDIRIEGGTINITAAGGYVNGATHTGNMGGFWGGFNEPDNSEDSVSTKGIKSSTGIYISGGTLTLDCADDALHTAGTVKITGGTLTLASGDDGIHADTCLEINDATVSVTHSYEGLESPIVTINSGLCVIVASDDGINATDGSTTGMQAQTACAIIINGGTIHVNASGDGIDSNNTATMNGGVLIVEGPTDSGNSALDTERGLTVNGGYIIATGSSGMAEGFAADSKQCAALLTVSNVNAGQMITVADDAGNVIFSTIPSKAWSALQLSSPSVSTGTTYHILLGGELNDGTELYPDTYACGKITGATELSSYVQESTVVSQGGMGGFGGGGKGQMPGGNTGERPNGGMRPDGGTGGKFQQGGENSTPGADTSL